MMLGAARGKEAWEEDSSPSGDRSPLTSKSPIALPLWALPALRGRGNRSQ